MHSLDAAERAPLERSDLLMTVVLRRDPQLPERELLDRLAAAGFYREFPPTGAELVRWDVALGLGEVVILRLAPDQVRALHTTLRRTASGSFSTEVYVTTQIETPFRTAEPRRDRIVAADSVLLTAVLRGTSGGAPIADRLSALASDRPFPPKGVEIEAAYALSGHGTLLALRATPEHAHTASALVRRLAAGSPRSVHPAYNFLPVYRVLSVEAKASQESHGGRRRPEARSDGP
jgi:hypothetical protein